MVRKSMAPFFCITVLARSDVAPAVEQMEVDKGNGAVEAADAPATGNFVRLRLCACLNYLREKGDIPCLRRQ